VPLNDVTMTAIHAALRGLSAQQRTIADNIANVETPGFLARKVEFERSLRGALAAGRPEATAITSSLSRRATGPNGNNVQIDEETLAMVETNLKYQAMTEAMNGKFRILRTSIRGVG
jgi:flagellar basal-body rod protein FlgB